MPYSVSFKTIGCRLNQAETTQINAQFEAAGWQVVEFGGACDAAVIHTCAITQRAESDGAQFARRARRQGARFVVLAGCAVEHNGDALKTATGADLIADQSQKFNLPALLTSLMASALLPAVRSDEACADRPAAGPAFSTTRALVKVQDGCDFRCSYCIVPETRGAPRSRPFQAVLDDIRRQVDSGHREITLAAANLGCYRDPPYGLIDLLAAADAITGLDRLRIGSIESTTVEREIIDFMARSRTLCRFLHLPLQSGDAGVLQRMQRRAVVGARAGGRLLRLQGLHQLLQLGRVVLHGLQRHAAQRGPAFGQRRQHGGCRLAALPGGGLQPACAVHGRRKLPGHGIGGWLGQRQHGRRRRSGRLAV